MSGSAGGEGVALSEDEQRTVAAEVAAVLGDNPELAAHIRDARSNEDPCPHWVGQSLAVCAPCLRDRLAPHVGRLVAAHLHARHAAALDEARAEWGVRCSHGTAKMPSEETATRRAMDGCRGSEVVRRTVTEWTTPPTPESAS